MLIPLRRRHNRREKAAIPVADGGSDALEATEMIDKSVGEPAS